MRNGYTWNIAVLYRQLIRIGNKLYPTTATVVSAFYFVKEKKLKPQSLRRAVFSL
jgi:hypothetical protein